MNAAIIQYLETAQRRKWCVIIPFLLMCLSGLAYLLVTPKIYEAQTLILVQAQRVPEDFVRTIVSTSVEDRLRTITQQVMSRTNLEKIINKYYLYAKSDSRSMIDDKVALTRKNINIAVSPTGWGTGAESNTFTISFRGQEPRTVMEVTNALASNFITENLKSRESQAIGTTSFLADELEVAEKRLMEKEEELKRYRERYMGALPEQLETNLSILERLQEQRDQLNSNLRDAENRRILIQKQMAEQRTAEPVLTVGSATTGQENRDIGSLRNELAALESRYTQNHPDVIRLKNMIAKLEVQRSGSGSDLAEGESSLSVEDETLRRQSQNIMLEINSLKSELKKVKSQAKLHQIRIEETPKREQELLSLKRDYENLQELYNSLLARKLEAEIAVSMEKKQKGEQFKVIDPAKIPSRPVEPDVMQIILLTLVLGLGLGGGLAFMMEAMDTSFKATDEIEDELQLPVLVSMPIRYSEKEEKRIKWKKAFAFTSVGLSFILSAIGLVLVTKGVDNTLEFVNKIFSST